MPTYAIKLPPYLCFPVPFSSLSLSVPLSSQSFFLILLSIYLCLTLPLYLSLSHFISLSLYFSVLFSSISLCLTLSLYVSISSLSPFTFFVSFYDAPSLTIQQSHFSPIVELKKIGHYNINTYLNMLVKTIIN